ncbi:hypothetical protein CEQ90_09050 [Lewinellaceae bacterium SD302]|nr:hypothetical protein CEQ90_09050 [Lewinellaceae bacterium SD302]
MLSVCPTEDCSNATDDDGDGLIDLNDPDCRCSPLAEVTGEELIFNGGFEQLDLSRPECQGCISLYDSDGCPLGWTQNSINLHSSCFTESNPAINIGYIAFSNGNYQGMGGLTSLAGGPRIQSEFLQTTLNTPLIPGQTYQFSGNFDLPTASQSGINLASSHRMVILGSNSSEALNSQGSAGTCYEDRPAWEPLGYFDFSNNANDNFGTYTISFVAPAAYSEFALASACCQPDSPAEETLSYYGVDELSLRQATPTPLDNQLIVSAAGCDAEVVICLSQSAGLVIQWYREGIALIGSQEPCLILPANISDGSLIQVQFSGQDNCGLLDTVINRDCSFTPEICVNGIDDDEDGLVDLEDPECSCQDSSLLLEIDENYCPTEISLSLQTNTTGQIQWYAGGTALVGENSAQINLGATANLNTTYRAVVSDTAGVCFATPAFWPSVPDELQFIWTSKVAMCWGDSNACLTAEPIFSTEPAAYNYSWTNAAGSILSDTAQLKNIPAGTYALVISTADGCSGNFSFTVSQPDRLTIFPFADPADCPTENAAVRLRLLTNSSESNLEHCYFDSQNNISDCSLENILYLSPGIYEGYSTNTNGCETSWGPVEISPPEMPATTINVNQETISLGETLNIRLDGQTGQLDSVQWRPAEIFSCPNCLTSTAQPIESQMIYVDYSFGPTACAYTDSIFISTSENRYLFIPNTFSPNFDGINDRWKIYPGPAVERVIRTTIYSRWGSLIYQDNGNTGWAGISDHGKAFSAGIYVYQLDVLFIDGRIKSYSGDLLLTR